MSSTIRNLHEISGRPMLKERISKISQNKSGLGPDDLMSIDKREKSIFSIALVLSYYHHVSGLDISSNEAIAAYFNNLLHRQENASFFSTKRYEIAKGKLYIWNSFNKSDVLIIITPTGPLKFTRYGTNDQITELERKQISLSSALRFYRGSQPFHFSLFGTRMIKSDALRVYQRDPIDFDDLIYVAENHPIDEELICSLTILLISSFETQQITAFLSKYRTKLPKLLDYFAQLISPNVEFAEVIFPLLDEQLTQYCDDLHATVNMMNFLIEHRKEASYDKYIPLLKNSIWASPLSAITIAKLFISQGKYEDALLYLNIATFAHNWPSILYDFKQPILTQPQEAPQYAGGNIESRLVNAPFTGANAEFFYTVSLLITSWPEFANKYQDYLKVTNPGRSEATYEIWPNPNIEIIENSNEELNLFDPGIHCEVCDELNELRLLPYSKMFKDTFSDVLNALERKEQILSGKSEKFDMSSALMLAVKLRDNPLINYLFQEFKKTGYSCATDKIVLLKANTIGLGPKLDEIFQVQISKQSIIETNALYIIEDIALGIEKLSNFVDLNKD